MNLIMNDALGNISKSPIREFTRLARQVDGCMFLTLGEPDFNTPDLISEQAKEDLDNHLTHYPENNGQAYLRTAISEFEAKKHGLHYSPDEVIVTVGATEGLFTALFGIINPGDEVIVPVPGYVLYEQVIKLCRGTCVKVDTTQTAFQLTAEGLATAITDKTKAIVLTSPNNPTGCLYTPETLNAIHEVLKDRNIFIICDDVYNQLIYTGEYHSFAEFEDMRDRVILVQSFSKPYAMTGWRVGYLCADAAVKTKLEPIHQYMVVSVPAFVQHACVKALAYDPSGMVEIYRKRRDYVYGRLVNMGLEVNKPEGAFYIFPSIKKFGMDSTSFAKKMLYEAKLAVTPGVAFGADDFVRISYCYSDEELKESMDRFEGFLKSLR